MSRLINTEEFIKRIDHYPPDIRDIAKKELRYCKTVDAVPVVRCKDCKYYELDSMANVNGIPLIVAHNICTFWGRGCKTDENGFCFMGGEKVEQ